MKNRLIKTCHWEITKRCNLSCIHCISYSPFIPKELTTKECLKVIDKLKEFGCRELFLTGGEPFVRKDIFLILSYAKKRGFYIGVITNGVLIDKKEALKMKGLVDKIGVSLDGSKAEINDKIRGKGTFKKIIKAINLLNSAGFCLELYITLCRINFMDLRNILKLASLLEIERVNIREVSLKGRALKNQKKLQLSEKEKIKLGLIFKKIKEKKFIKDLKKRWRKNCEINSDTIFLSSEGKIYSCVEIFYEKPSCFFKNILSISKKELIKYKKIFSRFKKGECLYKEKRGEKISICLNRSTVTKCPQLKEICHLIKSIQ